MGRALAVIPARGGSKRIPRKNVREFCGKPMIAHTIETALNSELFARVVVSTDDSEIAEVARAFAAEVPFVRPAELANDHVGTMAVMAHAVRRLREDGAETELACCLHATAPLMSVDDLKRGHDALLADETRLFAFSCASFGFPPQRALTPTGSGGVEPLFAEFIAMRSQDLPEAIHDAGQFYWGRARAFEDGEPVFGPRSFPITLDRARVQDIDVEADWQFAERLHALLTSS